MKSFHQIIRQPIRSFVGLLVVTLSVFLLVTSVNQEIATLYFRQMVESSYSTVALPTDAYMTEILYDENGRAIGTFQLSKQPEGVKELISTLPEIYPNVVQGIASHGFASAYVPEITPINFTQHKTQFGPRVPNAHSPFPYSCAVLVISITGIGEPYQGEFAAYPSEMAQPLSVDITGTVDEVVTLQNGFNDPTGFTVNITLTVPNQAALEALELAVGENYLAYTNSYQDLDYYVRNTYFSNSPFMFVNEVDPSDILPFSEEDISYFSKTQPGHDYVAAYSGPTIDGTEARTFITQTELDYLRSVSLRIQNKALFPQDALMIKDSFSFEEQRYYVDRKLLKTDSGITEVSSDEFQSLYSVPTMAKLSGTVDEFLSSTEGTAWRKAIADADICNHALPILGVDNLNSIADFARGLTRITQGRSFAAGEYNSGANVCIISETLAEANGLSVGSSISLQYYNEDPNLSALDDYAYGYISVSDTNLAPAFYSSAQGFSSKSVEYTIVGLYRQANEWISYDNPYSFTPNTVFVPQSSVQAKMNFSDSGVYQTILLHNGKITEFEQAVKDAGYENLFICYDQGYSEIATSLETYDSVSRTALIVGIAAWAALLIPFLAIFPVGKRKDAQRMLILGATAIQARLYVFLSGLGILIPGTVIGGMVGTLLWERVAREIMAAANVTIKLTAAPWAIPLASLVTLIVSTMLVYLFSIPLCKQKGLK